ncbi:drebrin-like protein B [Salmo salar]|uniref:Drebrin n=1 Tax=Salmo salar TaxID=8030 RepID=A0A1S3NLT2_SALSA|nr:drebrin-like protein B [Salmo salar]|eukprot:XP_014016374.1 PREDICTED: drebrin-like protein B [Salmo salar]
MRAINLDTYSLSLLTAKEDILNTRSSTNWALFTYDGVTNNLKLADSGAGGVVELSGKFHIAKPLYGLCRAGSAETGGPRVAMICWVGPNVDEYRRTECASHVPAIKAFFKEAHVFISAESTEDVTEEKIGAELSKVRPQTEQVRRSCRSKDKEETVGTNYRKTNAAMEMRRANRDSFWARAEREEEERKEEERKRAVEDRRRWEKERVLKERKEADERERKMNEKLQMIEEQRRMQAQLEAEVRKQEKSRWELQQREHEEDMRARLKRSESIEKAAEAAVLVSQRSMNPREFFRQLSSSSSQSPSSPGSPRTGKPPLRRYQRSLTDTAFIFGKWDGPTPTSPRSPTLVSPFSRVPSSPFHRTMSPPSTSFRPITSPQSPRASLVSPSTSPLHSAPAVSARPTLPSTSPQSQPPTQPSAPPASPGLLATLTPTIPENQHLAQVLPPSPPDTPPQSQSKCSPSPLVSLEPAPAPQPPTVPLPESPLQPTEQYTAVQAVLVEEEEDEEEQADPEPSVENTEPSLNMEEGEEGSASDSDSLSVQEPVAEEQEKEDQSDDSQASAKPVLVELSEEDEEPAVTDAEVILQPITQEVVVPSTNGVRDEGELVEHNGTERSTSPPERDRDTPELAVCFDDEIEEDFVEENEDQEISENGKEISPDRQMCVRALYDYQAEDESEISFEPGDIISAVETVDKAWWRGFSKDGRLGLFPANYVETI